MSFCWNFCYWYLVFGLRFAWWNFSPRIFAQRLLKLYCNLFLYFILLLYAHYRFLLCLFLIEWTERAALAVFLWFLKIYFFPTTYSIFISESIFFRMYSCRIINTTWHVQLPNNAKYNPSVIKLFSWRKLCL